jgi:hypothetical protein
METWVINLIILNILCHGCFAGAIWKMMTAEDAKRGRTAKAK